MGYNTTEWVHQENSLTTEDYILISLYGVIFSIGVPGNLIVIYVLRGRNGKKSTIQMLVCYLAIADMLGCVVSPVLFIYWQVTLYKKWHFGYIGCKVLPSMTRLPTDISLCIIIIFTIDKCYIICQPFKGHFSKNKIRLSVVTCIVLCMISEIPTIFYQKINKRSTCQVPNASVPGYAYPYITFLGTKDLTLSVVFITANYFSYKELYKGNYRTTLKDSISEKRKLFKILASISLVFMVTVFPRDILHIVYTSSWLSPPGINLTRGVIDLNNSLKVLHLSNGIYNIFIYARLHSQFQKLIRCTSYHEDSLISDDMSLTVL